MSDMPQRHPITLKRVVYQMTDAHAARARRDVEYRATDAGALTMDLYYPPEATSGARTPAVVFVNGFSDPGAQKMLGCRTKDMESYMSWGQLVAASGLVAITYANREPEADLHGVLQYVRYRGSATAASRSAICVARSAI